MMLYQKSECSEEIMKMDMEYEKKTTLQKDSCSRQTGILLILGVCMIVLMIMNFFIFLHQQRKFSTQESWMNSLSANLTSVNPDLQKTERQDVLYTEVKSLSSAVSALTSKLNDAVSNQDQKQTETKKILDNLSSSVTSLQSDLQKKQRDFESLSSSLRDLKSSVSDLSSSVSTVSSQLSVSMKDVSQTDIKSLMNNLSSAVSALTVQLNDAVNKQDQKQSQTERSLDSLKTSVESDQQNKQRDFESLSSSLRDLKSSVSDLSSSVSTVSSQLSVSMQQQDVKSLMNSLNVTVSALTSTLNDGVKKQEQKQRETERSLDSLKSSVQSDQQNKQRDLESLKSSLRDLKSSLSDLTSSFASISSKQQTSEERVMNALKELMNKISAKTADVSVAVCKSGWILYKSSCFLFSSNQLTWSEARDYCKAQDALLLKIQDNDEEWDFLKKHTIPTSYWVGLTDQTTGQWRWADGTRYIMNKERWSPGQPDDWTDHGMGEGGEDCGEITYTGKLNDNHCSVKMRFICRVQI
ncbi:C-type lectin domain family 4 member F-like isoform X1 [Carassius auratus]|uniref:C-type lectin domain family 4 member F-like isoform X1 n=1 Tax=Carassius auratus TaxID=7957 RepID=A0A6P6MRC6_CARAU|nr:C-type lectin domain family 4 member F-like isoform X1 [Carassius auratus]